MVKTFVVKVPGINGLGKTKGCEGSGNAILKVLKEEIYTSEEGKTIDFNKIDLEEIHLDNSDLVKSGKLIYKNAFETYETKPKTIFLGGDHSVSYNLTRAFFDYCENLNPVKEPCLIVFDAHPDLMKPMKEPTHEEWLRKLIEDGFPPKNILLVGIRNSYPDELKYIKEKGIRIMDMNKIMLDIEDACDIIMEFSSGKELYVSLDIDVVDPAAAPATGYRNEAGGLVSRQIIYLMQRINKIKNLRAVDIVEINEKLDNEKFEGQTIKLGAKILGELV
jgi:arginase family enzyme